MGYFGASTGAAAALVAAAELGDSIKAVVSRSGRPDLSIDKLPKVSAATLWMVGGDDFEVIEMNRRAAKYLRVKKKLLIIPGASHLFEEPGTLEQASSVAADWFVQHIGK
jgi:pimeloyl-ACP methyl ester carboxylesterase